MSLHQRHLHGRAIFGDEALHYLTLRKRDSHGDHIKMVVPEGFPAPGQKDVVIDTVVSNVFVTLPQSFTGTPDGLNTIHASATQTHNNAGSQQTSHTSNSASGQRSPSGIPSPTHTASFNPVTTHGASIITATPSASGAFDSGSQDGYSSSASTTDTSGSNSTSSASATASHSIGTVAIVGIVVGALVAFALLAGLLFFCLRRRKTAAAQKDGHNEKYDSMFGAQQRIPESMDVSHDNTRTSSAAPRLSLRPVTQFLPNLSENRKSRDLLGAASANQPKSAWERRPAPAENPFADNTIQEKARPVTPTANPFDENQPRDVSNDVSAIPDRAMKPSSPPAIKQFNGPAAPLPVPAPAVIAAGGAPDPRGPNNVHRVQLDFKPSMDDELELRSGQLVRMLHEYDDGWALCVRMDRSQQGVCPRTCLSKLPVKPRQGPPPNGRPNGPGPHGQGNPQGPGGRGPPDSRPRRPTASNGPSDNSHVFNSNSSMYPRPLTPTSNSERAESPNAMPRPVPGQAF